MLRVKKNGFSLAEILIASTLMGVMSLVILSMLQDSNKTTRKQQLLQQALVLQKKVEGAIQAQGVLTATIETNAVLRNCLTERVVGGVTQKGCTQNINGNLPIDLMNSNGTPLFANSDGSTNLMPEGTACPNPNHTDCRWRLTTRWRPVPNNIAIGESAKQVEMQVTVALGRPQAGVLDSMEPRQSSVLLDASKFVSLSAQSQCTADKVPVGLRPDGTVNCAPRITNNQCTEGHVIGFDYKTGKVICSKGGTATPIHCEGTWTDCSKSCGGGIQTYNITQLPQFGGNACPFTDKTSRSCNEDPCPVNCEGAWTQCSQTCGGGTRSYLISQPAMFGGMSCPFQNETTQVCNMQACLQN